MKEYKYTITTNIIGTEDGTETYEIRKTFDVEGKNAILIALYPTVSLIEPLKMDNSTMHLLNHMNELGYNDIRIINLFSKVFPRKPSLKQLHESPENMEHISNILDEIKKDSVDIVIAWGSSLKTNKAAKMVKYQILEMIREKGLEQNVKELASLDLEQATLCPHMLWLGLYSPDAWIVRKVAIDTILEDIGIDDVMEKIVEVPKKRGRKKKSKDDKDVGGA